MVLKGEAIGVKTEGGILEQNCCARTGDRVPAGGHSKARLKWTSAI
jgi:hypothetical protein